MTLRIIQSIKIKRTIEGGDKSHPKRYRNFFFFAKKEKVFIKSLMRKNWKGGAIISGSFSLSFKSLMNIHNIFLNFFRTKFILKKFYVISKQAANNRIKAPPH